MKISGIMNQFNTGLKELLLLIKVKLPEPCLASGLEWYMKAKKRRKKVSRVQKQAQGHIVRNFAYQPKPLNTVILTSVLCQLGRPLCDVFALGVALSEYLSPAIPLRYVLETLSFLPSECQAQPCPALVFQAP